MKISIEQLKKIILEQIEESENSSIIDYNTDYILTKNWPEGGSIAYDFFYGDEDLEKVRGLVEACPSLKGSKIVKAITARSFGKVFKLSNDHILKFFTESINVDDDLRWYQDNYEKMFTGTANINTLPIYDYGSIDMEDGGHEIHYVEMAELVPLDKWIVRTKRGDEIDARFGLSPLTSFYDEMRRDNKSDISKKEAIATTLKMVNDWKRDYKPFTQAEAESILGAFWEAEKSGWKLQDIAVRNMGILPQSDPNKPVIVIFDR